MEEVWLMDGISGSPCALFLTRTTNGIKGGFMIYVKSSSISGYQYDSGAQELLVLFTNGTLYSYSGVPLEVFDELRKAESIGGYFHAKIKANFVSKKVTKERV
jgi:hypothetical protein